MRKLIFLAMFPILAAAGCADDGFLHRVEVWKQQRLFGRQPDPIVLTAPMAPASEPTCSAPMAAEPSCAYSAPVAVESTCAAPGAMTIEPSDVQPVTQTVGSPEVIDGVLQQQ